MRHNVSGILLKEMPIVGKAPFGRHSKIFQFNLNVLARDVQ